MRVELGGRRTIVPNRQRGDSHPGRYTASCGISGFGSMICAESVRGWLNGRPRAASRCASSKRADGGYVVTIPG